MSRGSLPRTSRRLLAAGAAAACLIPLAACSSQDSPSGSADGRVSVVASTNVWGSVAKEVAGSHADVTSVISSPEQDPHDYEATARDKLAFRKAAVTVVNGGGYDDWATTLAGQSDSTLVDAVKTSGLKTGADFNEHVFYSISTARKVADRIATDLAKADPDHATDYRKNAKAFGATMDKTLTDARKVGRANPGVSFVATESVADYLLADMGLKDATPEAFVEQSETESGPSVKVVNQTSKLLTTKKAGLLIVNGQTSDSVTKALQSAARKASVPSVGVTETFPEGIDSYPAFINATITGVSKALSV
ncbi:metal ABC transporter solute-binding protein, Zn/Mn family [Acidipropionibacterium virtanenii]|uniref:Metal ABC transporter substrate-binding lipoprotein n=1 Tax=Acidipropionibacterium virtanenii TaxID=2057246 RepID=A0A344UVP3_9ACTN|nr:zinc ABC transporter substrate-binding protein [Acidipropionibacterium virtanenii]AXE39341.1 Metal ABC transporter substrate-binding lipoprotein [Acidipropionibacterium virtanenii]